MKKFIASILSIALLSTYGMILNVSADEQTDIPGINNDITLDTIGSNNYSFNELADILVDITENAVTSKFEAFLGGVQSVFEDEYYSYINITVKTEECKEIIENYCQEHNYSDVVLITVDETLVPAEEAIGYPEITVSNSAKDDVTSNNLENNEYIISDNAVVIVQDSSNNVVSKYYLEVDYTHGSVNQTKIDDTFDISQAEKIITISNDEDTMMYVDFKTSYSPLIYIDEEETFLIQDEYIPKDTTIGDSQSTPITEFTVGESTYPRGDINLDGNVNTVDLLMLKKYLLGLMEW